MTGGMLTDAMFDARVRTALAEEKGSVTVRALCEARNVPPTQRADWSRAAKRLASRGEAAAETLRNPGRKACLSNPMYYRLLPVQEEARVETTNTTNGAPAAEPAAEQTEETAAKPAAAEEPEPKRKWTFGGSKPGRVHAYDHASLARGVLSETPMSAAALHKRANGKRGCTKAFRAALESLVTDGFAVAARRAGPRVRGGERCDMFRLAAGASKPAPEPAPETVAMVEADVKRDALVDAAHAAHANWAEARKLVEQAEQETKDAAFALFCFDQGIDR